MLKDSATPLPSWFPVAPHVCAPVSQRAAPPRALCAWRSSSSSNSESLQSCTAWCPLLRSWCIGQVVVPDVGQRCACARECTPCVIAVPLSSCIALHKFSNRGAPKWPSRGWLVTNPIGGLQSSAPIRNIIETMDGFHPAGLPVHRK